MVRRQRGVDERARQVDEHPSTRGRILFRGQDGTGQLGDPAASHEDPLQPTPSGQFRVRFSGQAGVLAPHCEQIAGERHHNGRQVEVTPKRAACFNPDPPLLISTF